MEWIPNQTSEEEIVAEIKAAWPTVNSFWLKMAIW